MAQYKFNRTGSERKQLVGAISEILNAPTNYLGAPTFAYEVGGYHIDREGMVTGEFDLNLFAALELRGFEPDVNEDERSSSSSSQDEQDVDDSSQGVHHSNTFHLITPRGTFLCQERFDTAEQAEAAGYGCYFDHETDGVWRQVWIKTNPDGATEHSKLFAVVGTPFEKPEATPEEPAAPEFANRLTIEVPVLGFTPERIENLNKMVSSKESLLKKALGIDELPIRMGLDTIQFPWFPAEPGENAAYWVQFITALCTTAKEKKRVTSKVQ